MRRIYFESLRPDGELFPAPRSVVHYLRDVLRASPGDRFVIFDGSGCDYIAVVESVGCSGVFLRVVETVAACDRESGIRVCLCQSLLRGPAMDLVVQAATQIGVTTLEPVWSERCIVRPGDASRRMERWQAIAREAAKVSRRPLVPAVTGVQRLEESLSRPAGCRVFFWEGACTPLRSALSGMFEQGSGDVRIFVGPEGGYTDAEVAAARSAAAVVVSLGRRILKAEIAAIAAVLLVVYEFETSSETGK